MNDNRCHCAIYYSVNIEHRVAFHISFCLNPATGLTRPSHRDG
jgi:hypothetical protein